MTTHEIVNHDRYAENGDQNEARAHFTAVHTRVGRRTHLCAPLAEAVHALIASVRHSSSGSGGH